MLNVPGLGEDNVTFTHTPAVGKDGGTTLLSRSNQVTPRSRRNASTRIITGRTGQQKERRANLLSPTCHHALYAIRTRWRRADGTSMGLGNNRRRARVCGVERCSILRGIRCGRNSRRR